MSSGVVSKPNASARGSVVFVVAASPSVVVFSVVLGGDGVWEGMVSKPRACARESAADMVAVGAV